VTEISPNLKARVLLKDLATGAQRELGRLTKAGEHAWNVSEKMPWAVPKPCLLVIESEGEGTLGLARVHLEWPLVRNAPQAIAPGDGWELGELAVCFEVAAPMVWNSPKVWGQKRHTPLARGYELEIADDKGKILHQLAFPEDCDIFTNTSWMPDVGFEKGEYAWRVRALNPSGFPSPWSKWVKFKVVRKTYHRQPPKRQISRTRPLILLNAEWPELAYDMWQALPEQLKPFVAFRIPLHDALRVKRHPFPCYVQVGGGGGGLSLSRIEHLFRELPSLEGVIYAETSNFDYVLDPEFTLRHERLLKLVAMHGKRLIGIGTMGSAFHPSYKDYSEYVIPMTKGENYKDAGIFSLGSLLGARLAGKCEHTGAETEWYYPRNVLNDLPAEPVEWMPPWLLGLCTGAEVYCNENMRLGRVDVQGTEAEKESGPPAWYPKSKKWGTVWTHAMLPFLEDVVRFNLIPSKEQLARNCKVAIVDRRKDCYQWTKDHKRDRLNPFIATLYGVAHRHEVCPNTSRYGIIPVLPYWVDERDKRPFKLTIPLDEVDSVDGARKWKVQIDKLYPLVPDAQGEAFVAKLGELAVVMNTEERRDHAKEQSFAIRFAHGPVREVTGKVGFMQYLLIKQLEDGRLFIHANNYETSITRLRLVGAGQMDVKVEPANALVRDNCNEGTSSVELDITHKHGAVRVFARKR